MRQGSVLWFGLCCSADVYERLVPAGKKPRFVHLLVTQLVAGVWHVSYPQYTLSPQGGTPSACCLRCAVTPLTSRCGTCPGLRQAWPHLPL